MATKRLLDAYFAAENMDLYFNMSASSSDNIPIPSSPVIYDSKTKPLNQVGALFLVWDSNSSGNNNTNQKAVYKELQFNQYGASVGILPSDSAIGVKMYLGGHATDSEGRAMPYVKYVHGSYTTVLHYFQADDTDLGMFMAHIPNTSYPSFFAGNLWDDGTFTGDVGWVRPYWITPVTASRKRYEWGVSGHWENVSVIPQSIIDDLYEYLPSDPEGQWVSPGQGDFDGKSDPIEFPDLPTYSVCDTGMTKIYEMSTTRLRSLSQYLWSNNFDLDTFKKMFQNPMDGIMSLTLQPVDATTGASDSLIKLGNIITTCYGNGLSSPYKIIDFGTINVNEYWGNFGDYSPYTKLSIYLPYVGVEQISIDDVINGTVHLKAYCDVLTGSIQYMLKSKQGNRCGRGHNSVLYTWAGNCAYQIPLSGTDANSQFRAAANFLTRSVGVAADVGTAIATGGATAGQAASSAGGLIGGTVSDIMNIKMPVYRGGGLGGAVGLFGVQTPYLILERPEEVMPTLYESTVGVPADKTGHLGAYSGFVQVKACNLIIPGATKDELEKIESLLKAGVLV